MIVATLLLALIAAALYVVAMRRKDGSHKRGLKTGMTMLVRLMPLLVVTFVVAGMLEVVVPAEMVKTWLGDEAGMTGVIFGTIGGALIPGGPYVSFPIIASISGAGASLATAVAFVVGWATLGIGMIPFELALMGTRYIAVRLSLVFAIPFITGALTLLLFG